MPVGATNGGVNALPLANGDEEVYRIETSGACCPASLAPQVLSTYCHSLPGNDRCEGVRRRVRGEIYEQCPGKLVLVF